MIFGRIASTFRFVPMVSGNETLIFQLIGYALACETCFAIMRKKVKFAKLIIRIKSVVKKGGA